MSNRYKPPITQDFDTFDSRDVERNRAGIGVMGKLLEPGDRVGDLIVERWLGEGGVATVYAVRHEELDQLYAIKILRDPRGEARRRFVREARILAELVHPNIVTVHNFVTVEGADAIVIDYFSGGSLAQWLESNRPSRELGLRIFRGACAAIAHAHERGVVHRDLKPANILLGLSEAGEVERVVVSDFGVAKALDISGARDSGSLLTQTGRVIGTPAYMAPEQLEGAAEVGPAADIFSLGVILYELLSGSRPFDEGNVFALADAIRAGKYQPLRERAPDVPAPLCELVDEMLCVDPEQRTSDAAHLLERLEALARPAPEPSPQVEAAPASGGRSRWSMIAVASACLGLAGVAAGVMSFERATAAKEEALAATERADRATSASQVARLIAASRSAREDAPAKALALLRAADVIAGPDGGRVLSAGELDELYVRGGASRVFPAGAQVLQVEYVKRANALLAATSDGRVIYWSLETGEVIASWDFDGQRFKHLIVSPDDRHAVVVVDNEHADGRYPSRLIDLEELEVVTSLSNHSSDLRSQFSGDSAHLAAPSMRSRIAVWDIDDLREPQLFPPSLNENIEKRIECFDLSSDGERVGAYMGSGHLEIYWDKGVLARIDGGVVMNDACSLRFSEDGERAMVAGNQGVLVFDLVNNKLIASSRARAGRYTMIDQSAGVGVGFESGRVAPVVSMETGALIASLDGHKSGVKAAASDAVARTLYTGSSDRSVRVWSLEGAPLARLAGAESWVLALDAWSDAERGPMVAAAARDATARVFSEFARARLLFSSDAGVLVSALSSDGETLFYVDKKRRLFSRDLVEQDASDTLIDVFENNPGRLFVRGEKLFVLSNREVVRVYDGEGRKVELSGEGQQLGRWALSEDGELLGGVGSGPRVSFVSTLTGELQSWASVPTSLFVKFSPRADFAWVGHYNTTSSLYELRTDALVVLAHENKEPATVAMTEDSELAIVGFWTKGVEVWSLKERERIATLPVHQDAVTRIAISSDSEVFATGGLDATVRLFSLETREQLAAVERAGDVTSLEFDPSSKLLVSGALDGSLHIHAVKDGGLVLLSSVTLPEVVYGVTFDTTRGRILARTATGAIWSIDVPDVSEPSELLVESGRMTNLRVCEGTTRVVPVTPFPEPETVFAPDNLCGPDTSSE